MQSLHVQPSPCPKCDGVRFFTDGSQLGLTFAFSLSVLYCTSCGYVELYTEQNKLEILAQERAEAAKQKEKNVSCNTKEGCAVEAAYQHRSKLISSLGADYLSLYLGRIKGPTKG